MSAITSTIDTSLTVSTAPSQGPTSGLATVAFAYQGRVLLARRAVKALTLASDAAVTVSLAEVNSLAHVVGLRIADGPAVTVAFTSAAGSAQVLPVEGVLWLDNATLPITAITLTRSAGVESTVELFLGQRA